MQVAYYKDKIWKVILVTGGIAYLSEADDEGNNVKHQLNVWEHELNIQSVL